MRAGGYLETVMAPSMLPEYFAVRFRLAADFADWPAAFAVVTAYATTGETWEQKRNDAADRALADELSAQGGFMRRIVGYSPTTDHAEPGFAAELSFDAACDLGRRYLQDAVYYVRGDALFVSFVDARRGLVPVGSFRERLDAEPSE